MIEGLQALRNTNIPLAVFINPLSDESTTGWIHRLAHCNAVTIKDFREYIVGKKDLYNTLIEYKASYLKEKNIPDEEIRSFVIPESNSGTYINFSGSYCPYCFFEDETPYFRSMWSRHWIKHCLDHNTPLINHCIVCNSLNSNWMNDWHNEWGVCSFCNSPYSTTNLPIADNAFLAAKPHIPKLLSILERYNNKTYAEAIEIFSKVNKRSYDLAQETDQLALSIKYLKSLLLEYSREVTWSRLKFLTEFEINPYKFICCTGIDNSEPILQADTAYALAYEIMQHHNSEQIVAELPGAYQREQLKYFAKKTWGLIF